MTTSMTQQVRIAARTWGTLTQKCSPVWPRRWTVMITEATWSRGSRTFGRTSGYVAPRRVRVRAVTVAKDTHAGALGRPSRIMWTVQRSRDERGIDGTRRRTTPAGDGRSDRRRPARRPG